MAAWTVGVRRTFIVVIFSSRFVYSLAPWTNVPVKSKLQHPPPPRATPRAFEFFENFWKIPPSPGRKAVQMPSSPGELPDYCYNFSVACIMLSEAVHVNMVYQTTYIYIL